MAIDDATAALLAQMAASGEPPLPETTPAQARDLRTVRRADAPAGPAVAAVRNTRIPVSGGYVPVRILTPDLPGGGTPRGVIVWYHGGGWVLGGLDDAEPVGRTLAQRTGCVVVMVDYRLAPEYRFPTAVDDSWAALEWVAARIPELTGGTGPAAGTGPADERASSNGTVSREEPVPAEEPAPAEEAVPAEEPVPLIVAGDSAGGNLAAVMALRARAEGGPALAAQVLVYPVTDCDLNTTSYRDPGNALLLPRESMIWFWDHYVPVAEHRVHPDASPLRATVLDGLPPAVVITAEHDVLRDEGELYATRLLKSKVPVRHARLAGQTHGFFTMVGILPGADAGMDFAVAGLAELVPALGAVIRETAGRGGS
jgi:acetyl esterase